jgi:hypothetical protein
LGALVPMSVMAGRIRSVKLRKRRLVVRTGPEEFVEQLVVENEDLRL